MTDVRSGYLVVEGCAECGARSSFFSMETAPPLEDYHEGTHFWTHLGSSQAVKFHLTCEMCRAKVDLNDMMALMLSTCQDPDCEVATIAKREGKGAWIYVALCADSTHGSGKCVSDEGIRALDEYFNQNIRQPGKKTVVVPCRRCSSIDRCRGIVIADTGLTEVY
jgi:hypothetical protein